VAAPKALLCVWGCDDAIATRATIHTNFVAVLAQDASDGLFVKAVDCREKFQDNRS